MNWRTNKSKFTIPSVRGKLKFKNVIFTVLLLLLLFAILRNRSILFGGYSNMTDRTFEGMFASTLLIICVGTLMNIVYKSEQKFSKGIKSVWFALLILSALILLSTGGRLYAVSCIVAIMSLYTVYYRPLKINKFMWIAVLGFAAMAIWGYLRLGASSGSVAEIIGSSLYYLVTEPIYTSYALVKYVSTYGIDTLNFPLALLSGFLNIVPTVIFPGKANYIISYDKLGYSVEAPLGAICSFTSCNIEFGVFGTIIFVFILSMCLEKLTKKKENVYKVMYAMMCSSLMFTFFRDPFTVSIVKYMFEFSIVIPLIFNIFFTKTKEKKRYGIEQCN